MVRVDPWVKWRNLEIFKIWEGVSALEPSLFPLLTTQIPYFVKMDENGKGGPLGEMEDIEDF